jgi:DNA-binding CsgD family transcriptional regulator
MDTKRTERLKAKAVQLARQRFHDFYEKKIHPREFASYLADENFSWVGAAPGEVYLSQRDALTAFSHQRDMKEVPLIHVGKGKFTVFAVTEDVYIVVCEVPLSTDPKSGLLIAEKQRCTMVFVAEGEAMKIVHIHTSNPWTLMQKEARFPRTAGRANYEYMHQLAAEKKFKSNASLSPRQKLVLQLLSEGKTYGEIGKALDISPRTVRYHVGQLMTKYHVSTRAELMAQAFAGQTLGG